MATQTAKATDEISQKVTEIQEQTNVAVSSIEQIVSTITTVREISSTIAAAVEEQGAATAEIANNCSRAAVGTNQVTDTILNVGRSAEKTGTASSQLMQLSNELNRQAGDMKQVVDGFVQRIKAA